MQIAKIKLTAMLLHSLFDHAVGLRGVGETGVLFCAQNCCRDLSW